MTMVEVKPFLINGERPCIRRSYYNIARLPYDKDNPQQAILYKGVQLQRLSEKGYPKEKTMDSKRQSELAGNSKTEAEMSSDLFKAYKNKEWFESQYWGKQLSVPSIAKICKAGRSTVYKWVWEKGWKLRKGNPFGTPVSKEMARKIGDAQI